VVAVASLELMPWAIKHILVNSACSRQLLLLLLLPAAAAAAVSCDSVPQDMQYQGSTPATKNKASEIISTIRKSKRVAYLREKARRKGTDPALVERLVAMVLKYDL
jgi:hypothetical protein